jgi:diguanylate cyclase (GGDEF)-like protein
MDNEQYVLFYLDQHIILDPKKTYTIGRNRENDIILPHGSVSRSHAVIQWDDRGFIIRDRASTNGTFIDSVRVDESSLDDRSRIQIGVYMLEFRIAERHSSGSGIDSPTPADTMVLEGEFARLVRNAKDPALVSQIMDIKHSIAKKDRSLHDLVYRDGLTRLFNRRYFDKMLQAEFERAKRYGRKLCLIMIDIDLFKLINDRHGHQKGDEVLEAIAGFVLKVTRQNDIAARYGGEEICVLVPETSSHGGKKIAEKIRATVQGSSRRLLGIEVTVSAGVAARGFRNNTAHKLLAAADRELYRAKENGRNRVYADTSF